MLWGRFPKVLAMGWRSQTWRRAPHQLKNREYCWWDWGGVESHLSRRQVTSNTLTSNVIWLGNTLLEYTPGFFLIRYIWLKLIQQSCINSHLYEGYYNVQFMHKFFKFHGNIGGCRFVALQYYCLISRNVSHIQSTFIDINGVVIYR